jgi:hypothetical protein
MTDRTHFEPGSPLPLADFHAWFRGGAIWRANISYSVTNGCSQPGALAANAAGTSLWHGHAAASRRARPPARRQLGSTGPRPRRSASASPSATAALAATSSCSRSTRPATSPSTPKSASTVRSSAWRSCRPTARGRSRNGRGCSRTTPATARGTCPPSGQDRSRRRSTRSSTGRRPMQTGTAPPSEEGLSRESRP